MSKINIQPLTYRAGIGTGLVVTEVHGNPPLTVRWQIVTDTGYALESGEFDMQQQQWEDWPTGPDNDYIEKIAAAYLNVQLAE
jgi:hypothetical protein